MTIYLLDKSAMAQRHGELARARLERLIVQGRLAVCEISALEILYSARSPANYDEMARQLNAYRWLETSSHCLQRALEVQGILARTSEHRVPIPDLLIAATAERHAATVLHHDRDYDLVARVTGQPVERMP